MLRKMKAEDVPAIVAIHLSSWNPSEISVKLGPKFLALFYAAIAQAPDAFAYVFEREGKIVAYSTGFYRYQEFNRRFLNAHWSLFMRIVLSRFMSGEMTVSDVLNLFMDSRKMRNLRYPNCHWGANAISNEHKGTREGKEAYASTAHAVFRDLRTAGCGGCSVSCDIRNKAMERWMIRLRFQKVATVGFWGKDVLVYEKTFFGAEEDH